MIEISKLLKLIEDTEQPTILNKVEAACKSENIEYNIMNINQNSDGVPEFQHINKQVYCFGNYFTFVINILNDNGINYTLNINKKESLHDIKQNDFIIMAEEIVKFERIVKSI